MVAGTSLTLAATVFPDNATHQTIVWTVKSMSFKGMNAAITDGVLTADLAGTVKVTATIANGATASTDYKQDFDIAVTADFVPVTDITLATNTYVIGTSIFLFPIVTPSAATHNTIVWSVKDAGGTGAIFGKGDRFSATAAGTATITATITNGLTASTDYTQDFTITVIEPYVAVTDITLTSANTLVAGAGKEPLFLTADVTPTNATNQTIAWSITDEGGTGASIDGALHNRLRASTPGTITVTATITNGATASTKFTREFTITATAP
jgi:endo-1,4-beta-xylanase